MTIWQLKRISISHTDLGD